MLSRALHDTLLKLEFSLITFSFHRRFQCKRFDGFANMQMQTSAQHTFTHSLYILIWVCLFLHSIRRLFAFLSLSHFCFTIFFVGCAPFFFLLPSPFRFVFGLWILFFFVFLFSVFLFGQNKLSIQLMCWINTRMIFPCWPFLESKIYFYYFIRFFLLRTARRLQLHIHAHCTWTHIHIQRERKRERPSNLENLNIE